MIVDTSALIALLRDEPAASALLEAMLDAASVQMSAASYLEAGIVVDRLGDPTLSRRLDELLADLEVVLSPVTEDQARIARQGYRDYGKGSGHPAQLNFGDCFSYALAIATREPLLYVGADFGHTDVQHALPP